jgi:uncharacterized protein YcaQ
MDALTITKQQARRFLLAHQGLMPPHGLEGKSGALDFIRRVGCIQFDPLNIAGRNAELVLQARVSDFRPAMLEELLYEDRKLLDGWDKNMSIYSVEDWPYFHRLREASKRHPRRSSEAVKEIVPQTRKAIGDRGPLSSLDLDFDQTVDWSWAPTRLARAVLESMYTWGELIVHHKVNTRKVYDFANCHLPETLLSASDPNKTEEQFHDWYLLRRIGGVGLLWDKAGDAWLGMHGMKSRERKEAFSRLLERGKITEVRVDGVKLPLYMRTEDTITLNRTLGSAIPRPRAVILAPLDNLLWDRRFVEQLFGFSYKWEVYKPVEERRYGYYVLPIMYGDWWWESGIKQSARLRTELRRCIKRFMGFLGADNLQIDSEAAKKAGLDWLDPAS